MIIDRLGNSDMYNGINPGFKKAFDFLKTNDLANMEVGRYDIDGDKVFALVQEKVGYYPVEGMKAIKPYDAVNDFTALEDVPGDFMTLRDDIFMLLFPEDGHLPAIAVDQPMDVKKVVIKIKC